jgi:uncharacterized protein (DUF433 family)
MTAKRVEEKEKWLPIPEYEGRYDISNYGKVRSYQNGRDKIAIPKIIKLWIGKKGYMYANLSKFYKRHNILISGMVAKVFLGPKPTGKEVSHIDGNRKNNFIGNLIYETHSENMQRAVRQNTMCCGERHPKHKLTEIQVRRIIKKLAQGIRPYILAKEFGVDSDSIRDIYHRQSWKHVWRTIV